MVATLEPVSLTEADVPTVQRFRSALASPTIPMLVGPGGEAVPIPPPIYQLLMRIVASLAAGEAVSIVPIHQELTSQKAADLLGVSRQFLVRLLDEGKLDYHRTGTHRRIYLRDLLTYKRERDQKRAKALDVLGAAVEEAGVADRVYIPQPEA